MKQLFIAVVVFSGVAFGFDPEANVLRKEASLVKALAATGAWLRTAGAESNQRWRAFLKWEALEAEIAKASPDLERLKDTLNLWRTDGVGLEAPQFVSSQRALREYILAEEIKAEGDFAKALSSRRVELAGLLATPPDSEGIDRIGHLLGWLETTGQDTAFVRATRAKWAHPNVQLTISSRLVAYGTEGTTVSQDSYSTAVIIGMVVSGQAHVQGTVTAVPVASGIQGVGIVELQFRATVEAPHNYGSQRRVGIHSKSHSDALIIKRLHFGPNGLTAERARAFVDTKSQVTQIDAPGPVIRWIARRKSAKKMGQAEGEAEVIIGDRLAREFDAQVDAQIRKGQADQMAKAKRNLEFEGAMPAVHFNSNRGGLVMVAKEANRFQLAAPSAAPAPTPGVDLNVAVHESFTGNFMEPFLGNKIEFDTGWYDIHKLLTAHEPRPLRVHDRAPRWYLRVTEESPMVTRFRDGLIYFEMRGKEISWNDLKTSRPVEIHVAYRPVIEEKQPIGLRVGEVEVLYSSEGVESETDATLKKVIHEKMSAFFPERFELGGLSIPKGSGWSKFEKLALKRIESRDGWLVSDLKLE